MCHEIREGRQAIMRTMWIEDDGKQTCEGVVFDEYIMISNQCRPNGAMRSREKSRIALAYWLTMYESIWRCRTELQQ